MTDGLTSNQSHAEVIPVALLFLCSDKMFY